MTVFFASGSRDRTVRLWDIDTNLPVGPPLQHEHSVFCSAISADGKVLVTGCIKVFAQNENRDNNAYAWDIHNILKQSGHENLLSIPPVSCTHSSYSTS